eukprot:m.99731 g.99731  ORF g.99731 m.99731 type:complete len:434 (-) comp15353_c0_seq1:8-1309(-)
MQPIPCILAHRSPSDRDVRIHLVIGPNRESNEQKCSCASELNTSVPTVTSVLARAGYHVGHFGKWHNGDVPNGTVAPGGSPPLSAYGIANSRCYACNNPVMYVFSDPWFPSNSSRLIVDDAIAHMTSAVAQAKPFYLNLWFHISHAPLLPTAAQLQALGNHHGVKDPVTLCAGPNPHPHIIGYTTCSQLVYRASQFEADAQIGRLLDHLDATNLSSNTLVIFSGDNGPEDPHIYINSVGDPGPFRGRKRSLYDGGVRMVLLARWPGRVPAGQVSPATMMSADWLPTAAALAKADLKPHEKNALMGHDMSWAFDPARPRTPRTTPLMWDYRADGYGYCYHQAPRLAIRDLEQPGFKLLMNPDFSRVELFNVSESRFEANNLAHRYPEVVQRLSKQLLAWVNTTAPSPTVRATHKGCGAYKFPTSPAAPVEEDWV